MPYRYEGSMSCRKNFKNLLHLADLCAKLIEFITEKVSSPEFIARNRQTEKDFTRKRKLPFRVLIAFLLNFVKGSYQDELDKFFKAINRFDVAQRVVSKKLPWQKPE